MVGMLVILITPPGVEHGLAVLEEIFGPLAAPRSVRPAFFTPGMFLTPVFPHYRRRNNLSDCLAAFNSSKPPVATAGKTKKMRSCEFRNG